jgi:hypothetical protein
LSRPFAASANRRFQFHKRSQLFIRSHNETLSASHDRARIVFDCQTAHDLAMINKGSTNENNTDVDRWADARRLRINGKPCSKPWRCLNLRASQDRGNRIAVDTICACP